MRCTGIAPRNPRNFHFHQSTLFSVSITVTSASRSDVQLRRILCRWYLSLRRIAEVPTRRRYDKTDNYQVNCDRV